MEFFQLEGRCRRIPCTIFFDWSCPRSSLKLLLSSKWSFWDFELGTFSPLIRIFCNLYQESNLLKIITSYQLNQISVSTFKNCKIGLYVFLEKGSQGLFRLNKDFKTRSNIISPLLGDNESVPHGDLERADLLAENFLNSHRFGDQLGIFPQLT